MRIPPRPPISIGPLLRRVPCVGRLGLCWLVLLSAACGSGGGGSPPNTPLSTPMALVVNQDDTTVTTIRLDGRFTPVLNTLPIGPAQPDAIGGISFSLGEWIFVTHTAGNRVAFIDPIGGLAPILEGYLVSTTDPRIGLQPKRIYRDPVDGEILWTMNEGDDPHCQINPFLSSTATVSVLHNSHIAVGGDKPHIKKTSCLWGKGEQFAAFARSTAANPGVLQSAFISSKVTGLITMVKADPVDGADRWATGVPIFLCDSAKEQALGHPPCSNNVFDPNHSAPAGMFWSQATGKIYCYLSGYGTVVEIDPDRSALKKLREVTVTFSPLSVTRAVGLTPDGRYIVVIGEDVLSDPAKVIGLFGIVDVTQPVLSLTAFSMPQLEQVRPERFLFTPDGTRLYLTQSNSTAGLAFGAQIHGLKKDRLLVFDPSGLPASPAFVEEIVLPAAESHAVDLWVTGPFGAGSAKGIVVTNATPGVPGSVSLIDAGTHTTTATIPVGRNPKHVTVYYAGLAASDNQATPRW